MKIIAFIFARGGSKGLPGKNILPFCGKPLISWAIELALKIRKIDKVVVSTDCTKIQKIALECGAEAPFLRPEDLSQDETPEWLAWQHALNQIKITSGDLPDIMVSLPPTAPLRSIVDVEHCIEEYLKGGADIVISASEARRSPYFNMVKKNPNGTYGLVIPPQNLNISRRQDVPLVYDMTTVCYVANSEFVLNHKNIFEGRVKAVSIPAERSIDIDTALDFKLAEYLMGLKIKNL